MTFDEMVKIEPELGSLLATAKMHRHCRLRDREHLWFRELKKQMMKCVGFESRNEKLSSCECYDTAYQTLIKALGV
jgi:hypothetical protein